MRRGRFLAVLSAVTLLTATGVAFAQRTTGSIFGRVTDDSGALLPGVTVTVKGEAIVGTLTSVANAEGFYRFGRCRPVTYTTFSLSGFGTQNRPASRSPSGAPLEENAALKVAARAEEITVTGEGPVVDTKSNAVSTTYDKDWVRNAPIAPLHVLRPHQLRPRREPDRRRPARARPRSAPRPATTPTSSTARTSPRPHRRGVALAQHRRRRGDRGPVPGRARRVRQPAGSGLQRRHATGLQHLPRRRQLLLPEPGPHRPQHHRRAGRRAALQPRQVQRRHRPALAAPWSRTSCGSSGRTSTSGTTSRSRAPTRTSQPASRPTGSSSSRTTRSATKHKLMFAYHDDYYRIPARPRPSRRPAPSRSRHGHNPSPEPDLHRGVSPTRPTSRPASPASTARTTATR